MQKETSFKNELWITTKVHIKQNIMYFLCTFRAISPSTPAPYNH